MSESPDAHRVLVVDDEPNIVDVVAMALRFQGFAIESAGTGAEALAKVSSFKPQLIVLDVMLPTWRASTSPSGSAPSTRACRSST
jgi:two-component system OmpR family response regulator